MTPVGVGPPLCHDPDHERFGRAAPRTRSCESRQVEGREPESVQPCAGRRVSAALHEERRTPLPADRRSGPTPCAASPGTPPPARSPTSIHRLAIGLNDPRKATRPHGANRTELAGVRSLRGTHRTSQARSARRSLPCSPRCHPSPAPSRTIRSGKITVRRTTRASLGGASIMK